MTPLLWLAWCLGFALGVCGLCWGVTRPALKYQELK